MKMNRRMLRLGGLLLALLCLAGGAAFARAGLSSLAKVRHASVDARQRLDLAQQRTVALQQHGQLIDTARQLMAQSQQLGLDPARWVERKINLRTLSTSRRDVDRTMQETATDETRLFVTEAFDLAVLDVRSGLFDVVSADDHGLNLTLRGSFFTREPQSALKSGSQSIPQSATQNSGSR